MSDAWKTGFLDCFADPVVFLITCCCPCVTYGMNAAAVHGGSCPQHGITWCLSACCGLQGLWAGPTRKAIRDAYKLPQVPTGLGESDPSDFLVHMLGIISCIALCQEANEIKSRSLSSPLVEAKSPFIPKATAAPKQETMA